MLSVARVPLVRSGPNRAALPEVVVETVSGKYPTKRHLDSIAGRHLGGIDISQLDGYPSATIEVDHGENQGWAG